MDSILDQGDLLYSDICRVSICLESFLLAAELPNVIQFRSMHHDVIQQEPLIGKLLDVTFDLSLQKRLEICIYWNW